MTYRFRPHKYGVGKKEGRSADGFVFDSKLEMEWYLFLKAIPKMASSAWGLPIHVDVHPKVTLGPGDRVEADFCVWFADGTVEWHDVKSTIPGRLAEFKRLQRRWRHPAGPLIGIIKKGKSWERLEPETTFQE